MKTLVAAVLSVSFAFTGFAFAQEKKEAKNEQSAAQKRQQERMRDCNEQAGGKKMEGDVRKEFMSACLKGETTAKGGKMTGQQSRMRDCNRQASDKGLKGDERRSFMSSCLKS
jgi:Ni/Co efflux regulator RcnB